MVVACNFPPDASVGTLRTVRLVRRLTRSGWEVDVLTAAQEPSQIVDDRGFQQIADGARVVRARALHPIERITLVLQRLRRKAGADSPPQPASAGPRPPVRATINQALRACSRLPDKEVGWVFPAIRKGWQTLRRARPDVIFSSGPPFSAHLVAAALARAGRVPWIAEFRDPWARAPWRENRFRFEQAVWSVCERFVVTRADAVLFVTETNRGEFARQYGAAVAARFHVVPNGCDLSDFDGLSRSAGSGDRFVLLHAGSLYGARNPASLFKAAARAIRRGAIDPELFRIRFIGHLGVPGLAAYIEALGLERIVEFLPQLPRPRALQQMVDASTLLVIQPMTTVSIPAKVYEYMAAGPPILALAEIGGETARLVTEQAGGWAVQAEDEAAIESALVSLVNDPGRWSPPRDRNACDGVRRAAEVEAILRATIEVGARSSRSCRRGQLAKWS
jgi:glycosyltransferase involved in cell wall biosynthesis